MNYRPLNLFLALLMVGLLLAWLVTSYRLVPRTGPAMRDQSPTIKDPATQAGAGAHGIWRLGIKLKMDQLDIPAVQFAIFTKDPREFLQQDRKTTPSADPAAMWDLLFRRVPGDEVYLLSSNPAASAVIASSQADGKKWLVTKVARRGQRAFCWGTPFQAIAGKDTKLELSNSNVLDPAGLFSP